MSADITPVISDSYCLSLLEQLCVHPAALVESQFVRAPIHEGDIVVNATKEHVQALGKEALRLTVRSDTLSVARVSEEPIQIVHLDRATWTYSPVLSNPVDELTIVREPNGWMLKDRTLQVTHKTGFLTFWFQIVDRTLQRLNKTPCG